MIDLLTCLTAFLLITSVWSSMTAFDVDTSGRKQAEGLAQQPPQRVSVLVEADRIWIGDSRKTTDRWIARDSLGELAATLETLRGLEQPSVEVAGASTDQAPVALQDLIDVMSTAREAGYRRVGLSDSAALTTRPGL